MEWRGGGEGGKEGLVSLPLSLPRSRPPMLPRSLAPSLPRSLLRSQPPSLLSAPVGRRAQWGGGGGQSDLCVGGWRRGRGRGAGWGAEGWGGGGQSDLCEGGAAGGGEGHPRAWRPQSGDYLTSRERELDKHEGRDSLLILRFRIRLRAPALVKFDRTLCVCARGSDLTHRLRTQAGQSESRRTCRITRCPTRARGSGFRVEG